MKIVVNKEAALSRAKEIVGRVMSKAKETADNGKVEFSCSLQPDEMNGIDIVDIYKMIIQESEGTVKVGRDWKEFDNYLFLEIVKP